MPTAHHCAAFAGFGNDVYDLQFTPDSLRLVCTQNTSQNLNLCALIDVASGTTIGGLDRRTRSAEPHTALSHDGKLALTMGR